MEHYLRVVLIFTLTIRILSKQYELFHAPSQLIIKDPIKDKNYTRLIVSPDGNKFISIYQQTDSIAIVLATISSQNEVSYSHPRTINNSDRFQSAFWISAQMLVIIFENGICLETVSNIGAALAELSLTNCMDNIQQFSSIASASVIQDENSSRLYVLQLNGTFSKLAIQQDSTLQILSSVNISAIDPSSKSVRQFLQFGKYSCFYSRLPTKLANLSCFDFQGNEFYYLIADNFKKALTLDNREVLFIYGNPTAIRKVQLSGSIIEPIQLSQIDISIPEELSDFDVRQFGNNLMFFKKRQFNKTSITLYYKVSSSYKVFENIPFKTCRQISFIFSKSDKVMFTCFSQGNNILVTLNQVPEIQLNYIVPIIIIIVIAIITRFSLFKVISKAKEYPITLDWRTFLAQSLATFLLYAIMLPVIISTNTHQEVIVYDDNKITTNGSFFSRILYYSYFFNAIIFLICELYLENILKNKNVNMLKKHGLTFSFHISMRAFLVIFKSLLYGITAMIFIYVIQKLYLEVQQRVFVSFIEIANICSAYTICLANLIIFSISYNLFVQSFWYSTQNNLIAACFAAMFTEHLFMANDGTPMEIMLIMINPITIFYTILQGILQTQYRYANMSKSVHLNYVFIILITNIVVISLLYTAYTIYKYKKLDISNIIKTNAPIQNSLLQSRESVNLEIEDQVSDRPILSVFIPCKYSIYNGYEKSRVLQNIRFTAKRNQIITFIDYRNISKSHLFKILVNDQKSDSLIQQNQEGEVVYSENIKLSYCLDKNFYYQQLNAKEHIQLFLRLKKHSLTKEQIREEVAKMLDEFNIPQQEGEKKSIYLSGGYLKKMCLACAFIGDPDVIIIDEPTLGLDVRFKKIFWQKLRKWKENKLIIVGTSDSEEAELISDKIWILDRTKLIDYSIYKKKKLMIVFSLSFFTTSELLLGKELIYRVIKNEQVHIEEQSRINEYIVTLTIYSIQFIIYSKLKNIMILLQENLKNRYYFSFKIIQNKFHSHQYSKYYNNKCSHCDREEILSMIQQELNDVYELNQMLYQERNQNIFKKKAVDFLEELSKFQKRHSNLKLSQMRAIMYQRCCIVKNKALLSTQVLFSSLYFWMVTLYYLINREQSKELRWMAFVKLVTIYCFLHTHMISTWIEGQDTKKYLLTVGLNNNCYLIGSYIINVAYLFLPMAINIIIWFIIEYMAFFTSQLNFALCMLGSFLYIMNFAATMLLCSQVTVKLSLLFAMISIISIFPLLISKDIYLVRYNQFQNQGVGLIKYFYYPVSFSHLISERDQAQWIYILVLIYEYFLNILAYIAVHKLLGKKIIRKTLNSKDITNFSNESIRQEQQFIDNIEQPAKVVYGDNIFKRYKKSFALQNIYFHIKQGEVFGFLGHNGSGKTTLFKIITNKIHATVGGISFFGESNQSMDFTHRLKVGYCPQFYSLYGDMTVQQNIKFMGMIKGLEDTYIARFTILFIEYFRMKGNEKTYIKYLTEGERRKFSLIVAFLGFPKLLLFDETTTGIDTQSRIKSINLIKTYCTMFKSAALVTSHNISEAQQFCDRVSILKNGRVLRSGSPFQLKKLASQEMYRLIINIKGQQSQVIIDRKVEMLKNYIRSLIYIIIWVQEGNKLIYSLDMVQVNIVSVLFSMLEYFKSGVIEKFSFYKHDLEEVVKDAINNEAKLVQAEGSQFGDSVNDQA